MKSSKGSDYEREICARLSRWWTNGLRDDVYWRSAGSGARATTRGKRGRRTANQYGDVACTDPEGAALTDLFYIEIKRGYSGATIHDVIDKSNRTAEGWYESWFQKAELGCETSGAFGWLIITRRDRREPFIWMCESTMGVLVEMGVNFAKAPRAQVTVDIRDIGVMRIFGTSFANFLNAVDRTTIERMAGLV